MKHLRIGIVGCGTAGMASALFLARQGHDVTIFDRFDVPSAVGAGILVQPTGWFVLRALGLDAAIVRRGAHVRRLRCETSGGRTVLDLSYDRVSPEAHGIGLHRGVLFQVLLDAVKQDGIPCRFGTGICSHARGVLTDTEAAEHGPFDLVIAADGARSALRERGAMGSTATTYPWGALWCVVEDREAAFRGELFQVVEGPRRLLGMLPTGSGPDGRGELVSIFWSTPCDAADAWTVDLGRWKREVVRMCPRVAPLVETIERPEQLLFAAYHDVNMYPWHGRNVVYLGDAAHAMSPQLGQGANLALVDAMTLAESVRDASDVRDALERYTGARREHLVFYRAMTRLLTPWFQSEMDPLGSLRDWVLPVVCRAPFLGRRMVEVMAGLASGPFAYVPRRNEILAALQDYGGTHLR